MVPGLCKGSCLSEFKGDGGLSAKHMASHLVGSKHRHHYNLSDVFLHEWALRHRTLHESDVPLAGDHEMAAGAAGTSRKPRCCELGHCICDAEGLKLWRLSQRFLGTMKLAFPRSSPARQHELKESKVSVLVRGCPLDAVTDGQPEFAKEFLWLVGIMYLNPFRPTFRVCLLDGDHGHGVTAVRGTSEYLEQFAAYRHLDLEWCWWAKYFRMCESERPIAEFASDQVRMRPYQWESELGAQFWPPRRGGGGPRQQRAPP